MFVPKVLPPTVDASAEASGTLPPPSDPFLLRLTKPLQTHKGQVREIMFRAPVGRDYIDIQALPFDLRGGDESRRIVIDYAKSARWVSALTGLDEIVIGNMPREDFLAAVAKANDLLMGEGLDKMGNSGG
jgi:hypothetical protein